MRHLKAFFTSIVFLLSLQSLTAQYDVEINTDSLGFYSATCPTPVTGTININGEADNYNSASDSIRIQVLWGDGTSSLDTVQLYEAGTTDYFYSNFQHTYTLPGTYFIRIIATAPNALVDTADVPDSLYLTNNCVIIDGYTYGDNNSNCTLEATDDSIPGANVTIIDNGGNLIAMAWSNSDGYYSMTVPSGLSNLELSASTYSGMSVVCPSAGYYTINSNSYQTLNMALDCVTNSLDRIASHSITGVEAPGDTGYVTPMAKAISCSGFSSSTSIPDTLTLILDSNVTYVGPRTGPAPDVVSGNVLTWYHTLTIQSGNSHSNMFMPSVWVRTINTATILDWACFEAHCSTSGDVNLGNNTHIWCVQIDGPYDPNNKEVYPAGLGAAGNIDSTVTTLTYTVNFQNTGTAPAKNVYVLDSISDVFDLESIQILASSDPMQPYLLKDNLMRFDFPNINLPDSHSNEPESHGFFIFSIDLKEGLPVGTEIENFVDIYFDYNAPIRTNTTLNTIYEPVVLPDSLMIQASALDVTCLHNDNGSVVVNIISGNPPYTYNWSNGATSDYQDDLAPGTYTVTVTDNELQTASASGIIGENRIHESPIVGEINGPMSVQSWKSYTYHINVAGGSSFSWSVDGGEILSTTNNQVEVLWHAGPDGKIYVQEKDMNGCTGNDSTQVPILFVGIEESQELPVKVYPNPAKDEVVIELPTASDGASVALVDLQGRVIMEQRLNTNRTVLGLTGLSDGVYLLEVSNAQQNAQIKLIVQ